ncbi:MAG: phosphotransferase enzyme family protein [Chloroflexota bacterium]
MLEPPRLTDEAIIMALRAHYGIYGAALTFLPIGNDSDTWVYRLRSDDGEAYFVKLRSGDGFRVASLSAPFALREQGVPHVLAPVATREGQLWVALDGFMLTVYPFIEGRMGADVGLSRDQWRAFGSLARRIHDSRLGPEVMQAIPWERFVPSRRHLVEELQSAAGGQDFANDEQRAFAAFWQKKRDVIANLVERADELGGKLREATVPLVLCHADMHTWNVLLDGDGDWWLVDWDEVILARKERDLMFVIGGIGGDGVGSEQTDWFLQGYGDVEIDRRALAYYRYAWAVQDIAAFGEELFFMPQLGQESRRAALRYFMGLFEEGGIVQRALLSDQ